MAGLEWPAKRLAPKPQNATIVGRKIFGGFFGGFFGTFFGMGCAAANGHNLAFQKGKALSWGENPEKCNQAHLLSPCVFVVFAFQLSRTTVSKKWHSECNQPPVRSPPPICRMGLQCGLSRPHLTKHSDDAKRLLRWLVVLHYH